MIILNKKISLVLVGVVSISAYTPVFAQVATGGNYTIEHRVTVNGGNLTAN